MINKEKVGELYLKGHSIAYIAKELNCKAGTIRVCIHRNFKSFRKSRMANKIRDKEIDRITRFEDKQYMSDSVFIKKNRSIYETNADGDLLINTKVAPVVSYDTPQKLKNNNSVTVVDERIRKSKYRNDNILFSGNIT